MKRSYYLFPLMAMTALSLSLAACDDKKTDETAATETTTTETVVTTETTAPAAIIHAEGATSYATAEGSTTGAVFLTLHNPQATADRLVGASTPVATAVELHQSATDANGVATMTKVDAIEIQPGQQVNLEPTGYHIMLTGLTAPLVAGTPFDITLDFENAADVTLPVTVTAPAAAATEAAPMDHSTMDHGTTTTDTTTSTTTTTVDESPAPAEATTPTDEPVVDAAPVPVTDTTTPSPAAETPADEQPAQ